jgi:hypothetical protein
MDETANTQTNAPQDGEMGSDPASRLLAAERRLETARIELRKTMEHLGSLRRAALAGNHDPEALDQAVFACREAEARVRAARTDVERAQARAFGLDAGTDTGRAADSPPQPAAAAAPPEEEAPVEPLEVTPRLLFARWLVETGRLNEQLAA